MLLEIRGVMGPSLIENTETERFLAMGRLSLPWGCSFPLLLPKGYPWARFTLRVL